MPTRRNKDVLFAPPSHILNIIRNVHSRKWKGIQHRDRINLQNKKDRYKYKTRSIKNLDRYIHDLNNFSERTSQGKDVTQNIPVAPRLYEKSVIFEHPRVSPLKLGKRLSGTRFGGF
jgi:hypothetical protein